MMYETCLVIAHSPLAELVGRKLSTLNVHLFEWDELGRFQGKPIYGGSVVRGLLRQRLRQLEVLLAGLPG